MRVLFHVPYPLDPNATSASGIRPVRMLQAFRDLGHEVWTVSGTAAQRAAQMRKILAALDGGTTLDVAYSESSTMPTSMTEPHHLPLHPTMDLRFLGQLRRRGVRVGLFYRDIQWRDYDYAPGVSWPKRQAALAAYRLDLELYQRNLDVMFLPSLAMADLIPEVTVPMVALPPGHQVTAPAPLPEPGVRLLYVGGIGAHYQLATGMRAVHEAFARGADVRYTLCLRTADWAAQPAYVRALAHGPVEVRHLTGADLDQVYAQANVASLLVDPLPYWRFAMPVKLFEYLGQGRGVLASAGTMAADVVDRDAVGWVVANEVEAIATRLVELATSQDEVTARGAAARRASDLHTWTARAQQAIDALLPQCEASDPHRVLLVSAAGSIHTARWANALAADGMDVHLASVHEPAGQTYDPRVRLHRLRAPGPQPYVTGALALARLVDRLRPDLVNAHYATGYGTLTRLGLSLARAAVPYQLNVWGSDVYEAPHQSAAKRRLVRTNLATADLIGSTSHAMAGETARYTERPIVVTPFGIDTDTFTPAERARVPGPLRIGTVKAMQSLYGIDTLLRAFAESGLATQDQAELHLWGGGAELDRFRELADEWGIGPQTYFHGVIAHGEVPEALRSLDIFCALSREESFGVAALEAMSCGIPVVVSDAAGLSEVTPPDAGLIVAREDVAAASAALRTLADDPSLRARMGRAGREHVSTHYSWPVSVATMRGAYSQTAAVRRSGRRAAR